MKIGDKLYCKKNFYTYRDKFHLFDIFKTPIFKKDNLYEIYFFSTDLIYIKNTYGEYVGFFQKYSISCNKFYLGKFFLTTKEYKILQRKLKLKKLKKV